MASSFQTASTSSSHPKDQYSGRGKARASAIQQGHFPPLSRVPPRVAQDVLVDEAYIDERGQKRASNPADLERSLPPETLEIEQTAGIIFSQCGEPLPDPDFLEEWEQPQMKDAPHLETRLAELRSSAENVKQTLHELHARQFGNLVKAKAAGEDRFLETHAYQAREDAARNQWTRQQEAAMGKRQKQQMIKYAENHHIEMFPLSITIRPPAIDPNATQRPGGIPPSRSQSDGARSNITAWPASNPPLGNTYGNAPLPNSIQTSFAAPYQQSFQISSPTQQNSPLSRRTSLDSPSTLNVGSTMAHASPLTALDQSSYWSSLPQQEARSANTPISSLPARPSWSTAIATNQATITAAGASATLATTASGPVRTGSAFPVTFEEYKTLGEQRKYAVARYLLSVGESGRGNVQRLPGATDEDEKRLYNEYLANPAMRAEVKTLVDSKISSDPRKKRRTQEG